ncbi:MAG TPA: hypothetical protein VGC28_06160, partial [Sphingomonas sp.]
DNASAAASSAEESAPATGHEPSATPKIPDEVIEAEVALEEAEIDEALADNFGAGHQGGMGAQGGQTDFGNPGKFGGSGA